MNFEQNYFKDSEVSNYKNYMEKKHSNLVEDLINHLNIEKEDAIIDFGAATGNLLLEFTKRQYNNVCGTDISYFAVDYGKKQLQLGDKIQYFNLELLTKPKDFVLFLDVLEHIPSVEEINKMLELTKQNLRKKVIVRIPVSKNEGDNFYLEVSRNDKTHVQCHCKGWWRMIFEQNGFKFVEELKLNSIYSSEGVYSAVFELNKN